MQYIVQSSYYYQVVRAIMGEVVLEVVVELICCSIRVFGDYPHFLVGIDRVFNVTILDMATCGVANNSAFGFAA